MEELLKRVEEAGLNVYQQQPSEDTLLLRWWMDIVDNGDIDKLLPRRLQRLPIFLNIMQPPNVLVYSKDVDNRIWLAAWFEELFGGAIVLMGLWVHPDMRATKKVVSVTGVVYEIALAIWPTIFGVTVTDLLDVHMKLGYTVLGEFEKLWDGESAGQLVCLTKEGFDKGYLGGEHENLQEVSN